MGHHVTEVLFMLQQHVRTRTDYTSKYIYTLYIYINIHTYDIIHIPYNIHNMMVTDDIANMPAYFPGYLPRTKDPILKSSTSAFFPEENL